MVMPSPIKRIPSVLAKCPVHEESFISFFPNEVRNYDFDEEGIEKVWLSRHFSIEVSYICGCQLTFVTDIEVNPGHPVNSFLPPTS